MKTLGTAALTDFIGATGEGLITDEDGNTETLAEAIARIGSTQTVFFLDENIIVDEAIVWPATLKARWGYGARFVNDEGSIEFQGNPFVDGQELGQEALFEGFGIADISFTSDDAPPAVSSEIAYHPEDSVTQRIYLLTNWFEFRRVTFHCFPRPQTDTDEPTRHNLVMKDNHSLYFRNGVFTNTFAQGGLLGASCWVLGNYCRFSSESGAARIQGSSVNHANQLVTTKNYCQDTVIEGNYFDNGGGNFDGASFCIAIGPGSFNCHIRNNSVYGLEGYQLGIASSGGNVPLFCTIDGNYVDGFITQNIALIGGRHCKIINNFINVKDYTFSSAYATLIDIEPNMILDVVEDLEISNNYIDFRGTELYYGHATGSLTANANPANGDTILVNGVAFTFITGASTATEVHIGATKEETMSNFSAVLNASVDASVAEATYTVAGAVVNIRHDSTEWLGQGFTLANSTGDKIVASGATLAGGGTQYGIGILVQGVNTPGAKRVRIKDNVILSDDDTRMQIGISANGVIGLEISGNKFHGVGTPWGIDQCHKFEIFDNVEYSLASGAFYGAGSSAKGFIYNNVSKYQGNVTFNEYEKTHPANSDGTTLLLLGHGQEEPSGGRIYESYIGLNMIFNDVEYTILDVNTDPNPQQLTINTAVPASHSFTFLPAAIDIGTDTITKAGHTLPQNSYVHFWTEPTHIYDVVTDVASQNITSAGGGFSAGHIGWTVILSGGLPAAMYFESTVVAVPNANTLTLAGQPPISATNVHLTLGGGGPAADVPLFNSYFYVSLVGVANPANELKLATTRANAIAGTPVVNFSDQGTGTHLIEPVFLTKFSSNVYRANKFDTINLVANGTSYVGAKFSDKSLSGLLMGIDLPSIAANTTYTLTLPLTGARVHDLVEVGPPYNGLPTGLLLVNTYVSANDEIKLVFYNTTGAPIDMINTDYWPYKLSR